MQNAIDHEHTGLTWRMDAMDKQLLLLQSAVTEISKDMSAITTAQQRNSDAIAALTTSVQVIQARLWLYPAVAGFVGALVGALLGAGVAAFIGILMLKAQGT